jgi:hypothetical protein
MSIAVGILCPGFFTFTQDRPEYNKMLEKRSRNIDIINHREGLTDKLQLFTLNPEFVLSMPE